ncbi:hypothetical protein GIB67_026117 [Kingdonia uniflora]|uniref:RRM domain-containing protein n=1 Tax=Kingdonia uniflora TaxID=39325 RepID=A0A7J7M313_9MAGN|nr:hypothetical protein GIB67_026117 [Kingdonia uniflora]
MGNNQKRKQRQINKNNKKQKLPKDQLQTLTPLKPSKKLEKSPIEEQPDSNSEPERIQKLLEPYSKDQLIEFLLDASLTDSSLLDRIRNTADSDIVHRKVFVHGLGWDTTRETLLAAFDSYGEIEDCNVVVDRSTGKSKGFGFVVFKSRLGAKKALKEPQKKIGNRVTASQLASIGPVPTYQNQDTMARKIYVSNVHASVDKEKLRVFFAKFGEIETGPLGFDVSTGKSRGFALFVYKNQEGVKNVLKEPYKMFDGHQLHCQKATANKTTNGMPKQQAQPAQASSAALAAAAAVQNFPGAFNPGMIPYNGMLMNPNARYFGAPINPLMAGMFNPSMIPSSSTDLGRYGGLGILGGGSSVIGAGHGIGSNSSLQGLQPYQSSYLGGQSSSSRSHIGGNGYPSYMWFIDIAFHIAGLFFCLVCLH